MTLSAAQIAAYASGAGFTGTALVTAVAVALAESTGNPAAINPSSQAAGLWQVLPSAHPEYQPAALLDPAYNARAAYAISDGGSNWRPWTTYTSGAYTRFLSQAQEGAGQARQTPGVALAAVGTRGPAVPVAGLLLLGAALLALVW